MQCVEGLVMGNVWCDVWGIAKKSTYDWIGWCWYNQMIEIAGHRVGYEELVCSSLNMHKPCWRPSHQRQQRNCRHGIRSIDKVTGPNREFQRTEESLRVHFFSRRMDKCLQCSRVPGTHLSGGQMSNLRCLRYGTCTEYLYCTQIPRWSCAYAVWYGYEIWLLSYTTIC